MPICPLPGIALSSFATKKTRGANSSADGALNDHTSTPSGFTPDMTCLIVPSFPPRPWPEKLAAVPTGPAPRECSANPLSSFTPSRQQFLRLRLQLRLQPVRVRRIVIFEAKGLPVFNAITFEQFIDFHKVRVTSVTDRGTGLMNRLFQSRRSKPRKSR